MQTKYIHVQENTDYSILDEAASIIRSGGLVAFPTETVYGLGANALDAVAVKKIYEAKGRPSDNPLIAHVADMEGLYAITNDVPETARVLADRFWPGPMTIILDKNETVPYETSGGLETVAVRMPSHELARELIRRAGVPIAAPSANTSGRPSPTSYEHVKMDLDGRVDMIIDGGAVEIGVESTIIDVTSKVPTILRPGAITYEMLVEAIGEVAIDDTLLSKPSEDMRPIAPGMKYRHYAPRASMSIVCGQTEAVVAKIKELVCDTTKKIGILTTDENRRLYEEWAVQCPSEMHEDKDDVLYGRLDGNLDEKLDIGRAIYILSLGSRDDEASIASSLFAKLRQFDELGVDTIYAEGFETKNLGLAIMNRMMKAAGYHVINV